MSNKLRSHVVSDKIKWIIAFVLIALLCIGTSLTVVKLWIKPDLFEKKTDETETVAVMRYTFASLGEGVPSSSIALMSSVMPMATSKVSWSMSSDQSTATFTAVDPFMWSISFGGFSRKLTHLCGLYRLAVFHAIILHRKTVSLLTVLLP